MLFSELSHNLASSDALWGERDSRPSVRPSVRPFVSLTCLHRCGRVGGAVPAASFFFFSFFLSRLDLTPFRIWMSAPGWQRQRQAHLSTGPNRFCAAKPALHMYPTHA